MVPNDCNVQQVGSSTYLKLQQLETDRIGPSDDISAGARYNTAAAAAAEEEEEEEEEITSFGWKPQKRSRSF
jgi:hypothetical protein